MLSSKQRANLKSQAQRMKPLFQVGASELHENNIKAIGDTFNNKELIKVKVNRVNKEDKNITKEIAESLTEKIPGVEVVGVIGTTIILYKEHKEPEKRMDINVK
jgi:RNA-binding protein